MPRVVGRELIIGDGESVSNVSFQRGGFQVGDQFLPFDNVTPAELKGAKRKSRTRGRRTLSTATAMGRSASTSSRIAASLASDALGSRVNLG